MVSLETRSTRNQNKFAEARFRQYCSSFWLVSNWIRTRLISSGFLAQREFRIATCRRRSIVMEHQASGRSALRGSTEDIPLGLVQRPAVAVG
jgi:hypothetical protein